MTSKRVIELTEQDVIAAVKNYVRGKYADCIINDADIEFFTSVRGDYDRGDAKRFVQSVVIEIEEAT